MEAPRIYFSDTASLEDHERVEILVLKNYPGLLETGHIAWSRLHANRYRRHGGIPYRLALRVMNHYNRLNKTAPLRPDNMSEWNTNLTWVGKAGDREGTGLYDIPFAPQQGQRQLMFFMFPRDDQSDTKSELEQLRLDRRFIISPWYANDSKPAMERWNVLLNQSTATIAMESDNPYPLRVILPDDLSELARVKIGQMKGALERFVCVLILKFKNDLKNPAVRGEDPGLGEGFFPLFVYKVFDDKAVGGRESTRKRVEPYVLFNFKGDMVDWGDYSKRHVYTFYELRDIMAHLTRPGRGQPEFMPWVMVRTPPVKLDSKLNHYLVRKRKPTEEEESATIRDEIKQGLRHVCINWEKNMNNIQIVPRDGDYCEYEGDTTDFDHLPAPALFHRENLDYDTDELGPADFGSSPAARRAAQQIVSDVTTTFAEFPRDRLSKRPHGSLSEISFGANKIRAAKIRRVFGVYGVNLNANDPKTSSYLVSAHRYWESVDDRTIGNPLRFLLSAVLGVQRGVCQPPLRRELSEATTLQAVWRTRGCPCPRQQTHSDLGAGEAEEDLPRKVRHSHVSLSPEKPSLVV